MVSNSRLRVLLSSWHWLRPGVGLEGEGVRAMGGLAGLPAGVCRGMPGYAGVGPGVHRPARATAISD